MEVSNGTGQNTDYRVSGTGGPGQSAPSLGRGRRGTASVMGKGKLASNTFVSVTPPAAPPPWVVEFLRNGVVIAKESVHDPEALVVLMQKENGDHKVVICRRPPKAA